MSGPNDTVVTGDAALAALAGGTPQDTGADLPSHLQGKSSADLAAIIAEKDAMIGRQSQEVGQLRGEVSAINARLNTVPQHPQAPADSPRLDIKPEDLVENPGRVIETILENYDAKQTAAREAETARVEQALSNTRLVSAHPDYAQVSSSPEFATWAAGSPLRASAYNRAVAGDPDAAISLLTEFKQHTAVNTAQVTQDAHEAARNATLTTPGQTGAASSGPRYKASELMKLKVEDPEEYSRLSPEILKAYAEGRVV